ncbi:MAG: hypothetical protein KAI43_14375 [Candidatus Aureabacteria bacterium]|nr:hypothetical protein [Candidatus Auribacterota bacterium]
MKNMNGSIKINNVSDIFSVLKKRRNILENLKKAQVAFWIMLKQNNLDQITEMFGLTNSSLEKLSDIDASLMHVKENTNLFSNNEIDAELLSQIDLLTDILEQDKKIKQSIKGKKLDLSESLKNCGNELNVTHAYMKNIPKKDINILDKEI